MKISIILLILILSIAYFGGLYRIFLKANEKGWKALIPVYNIIVLLKVLGRPRWFIVFFLIPAITKLVFPYISIQLYDRFGIRKFWKVFLATLFSLFFIPLIGFSKKYNFETRPVQKYNFKKDFRIWGYALIISLLILLFVRSLNVFWYQNYKIPTAAMEHSILIGDHIFVNKLTIGPRLPITPLSLPFNQNIIPGTRLKSYVEWIKLPYIRMGGSPRISRNDIIAFNFPEGDTVCADKSLQSLSYYYLIRNEAARIKSLDQYAGEPLKREDEYYMLGRKSLWSKRAIIVRPIDRRDRYIKRCIAVPGDTLKIIAGRLFINEQIQQYIPGLQFEFAVNTEGRNLNLKTLKNLGISDRDYQYTPDFLQVLLSYEMVNELRKNKFVQSVNLLVQNEDYFDNMLFPYSDNFRWNVDYYGPVYIPGRGVTIDLTLDNLPLYKRIIGYYEKNELEVKDSIIYINGEPSTRYRFKMDYYWVMGDNRHRSLDSRYWGFVPEDHIIGKASFIWWSQSKERGIQWKRIFKKIN